MEFHSMNIHVQLHFTLKIQVLFQKQLHLPAHKGQKSKNLI